MDSYITVFGAIFVASLVLTLGIGSLRRLTRKRHAAKGEWTLDGSIFSFFAALYAFFLGFCVVTLWGDFGKAKIIAASEATSLQTAAYQSRAFLHSDDFRRALSDYMQAVIVQEWPTMNQKGTMSPQAQERVNRVWEAFQEMRPGTGKNMYLDLGIAKSLENAAHKRNERALLLSDNIYPPIWVIIFFGLGGLCLSFYCANPGLHQGQALLMFVVFFMVLSCIYFIYDISTPFSGLLSIPPDVFVNALNHIGPMTPALPSPSG